jgi:hypothetical protein
MRNNKKMKKMRKKKHFKEIKIRKKLEKYFGVEKEAENCFLPHLHRKMHE